ncbi:MAG: aminotransferase class III-fold pyridoxal phosphate-dependent enzyme [Spirulina sp.]
MKHSFFEQIIKAFRSKIVVTKLAAINPDNFRKNLIESPIQIDSFESVAESPSRQNRYRVNFIDSDIPDQVMAGQTYGAWVALENKGNFPWLSTDATQPVNVFVQFDRQVLLTLPFPRGQVLPGERVEIYFSITIPNVVGDHELIVDLVQQNVTRFSDQGADPLRISVWVTQGNPSETSMLVSLSRQVNPWFYQPTGGIWQGRSGNTFPVFVSKAQGCHIWDSQNQTYIDYVMGWGCYLLGYADQRIQDAIRSVLDTGAVTPFPYGLEMEVSQMLIDDFPCAEMVVFGKNGSDVCTVAARLSRAYTGKRIILCSGYHGWQDFWVERMGFEFTGIPDRPEALIHAFKFNDLEDFNCLYERYRDDLAAVMLEPAGPAQSIQGHFQDASTEFLQTIAEKTRQAGALLIFDEIVTGYRYPGGSVQRATGVVPDLACLGKAIASGMPLSALVGRAEIFRKSMGQTHYGPTFKGEMYSFAAAKAAIEIYRSEPIADFIWDYGKKLQTRINALCYERSVGAQCLGPPFRMGLVFDEPSPELLRLKRTLYYQELLKAGIVTYNGIMLPSYAHNEATFHTTVHGIEMALDQVCHATSKQDFHRRIEIPLL